MWMTMMAVMNLLLNLESHIVIIFANKLIFICYLLLGRQVMLEQPKKSGGKLVSHILASHGGDSHFSTDYVIIIESDALLF